MVENPVFGVTDSLLPLHRLCLRDMGSFLLVAPSSRVAGAIGSAVNPIAFK